MPYRQTISATKVPKGAPIATGIGVALGIGLAHLEPGSPLFAVLTSTAAFLIGRTFSPDGFNRGSAWFANNGDGVCGRKASAKVRSRGARSASRAVHDLAMRNPPADWQLGESA
jgi:hypothetical protein